LVTATDLAVYALSSILPILHSRRTVGKLIWAESYDLEPDNAQAEAASRIARAAATHLQPRQIHP